jgi:hypothetical protein
MTHQEGSVTNIAPPPATGAQAPSPQPPPDAPSGRLARLLAQSQPYRDLIGIVLAAGATISAGVAWAVAHFATEAEVFHLECRMNSNILAQMTTLQKDMTTAAIDWRSSQIKQVLQLNPNVAGNAVIAQLTDEIAKLNHDSDDAAKAAKVQMIEMAAQCDKEAPGPPQPKAGEP